MNKRVKIENAPKDFIDPKLRMQQIRQEVNDYLSGKHGNPWGISHLGELPETMDDARRVIVALQDLLDAKTKRHQKASDHIRDLQHDFQLIEEYQEEMADAAVEHAIAVGQKMAEMESILQIKEKQLEQVNKYRIEMATDLQKLTQQLFQKNEDIAALKRTIKISLGE